MPIQCGEVVARWKHRRKGHNAVLAAPFTFGDDTHTYTVPVGFETDFGSIPKIAQRVVGILDAVEAFVAHDWLYATGKLPRKESDRWMYRIMIARTVHPIPLWKAKLMRRGVRLGGWKAWRAHRKKAAMKFKRKAEARKLAQDTARSALLLVLVAGLAGCATSMPAKLTPEAVEAFGVAAKKAGDGKGKLHSKTTSETNTLWGRNKTTHEETLTWEHGQLSPVE